MDARTLEKLQHLLPIARKTLNKQNPTDEQVLSLVKAADGNLTIVEWLTQAMVLFDGLDVSVPSPWGGRAPCQEREEAHRSVEEGDAGQGIGREEGCRS